MSRKLPLHVRSITEYHRLWQLPKPEHPLVSVVDIADVTPPFMHEPVNITFDFYCISMKRASQVKFRYGQQMRDFDEGILFFMAPGQVFGFEIGAEVVERPTG